MLEVTEIFCSLQGEGPFSGEPATFVRLSGCIEPFCPWCDTMYACENSGTVMEVDEVYLQIEQLKTELVVITGGEPFLQWEAGLQQLEALLLTHKYRVQYETGGKVAIPTATKGICVCSPKFIDNRWVFDEDNLKRAQVFKFVVDNDFRVVQEFVQRYTISPKNIFIMPKGTSREEQLEKFPDIWSFCVENNFRFSPRLHVLSFNNKRGI